MLNFYIKVILMCIINIIMFNLYAEVYKCYKNIINWERTENEIDTLVMIFTFIIVVWSVPLIKKSKEIYCLQFVRYQERY